MKTLNKIAVITFAGLSLSMGICAIVQIRFDLGCLSVVCGGVAYLAYLDYTKPE